MKMLTGFLGPTPGHRRFAEWKFRQRDIVANQIGYLPENGPLYEEMTPLGLLNFFGDAEESIFVKERIENSRAMCSGYRIEQTDREIIRWF